MKDTRLLMGMPITVEIIDPSASLAVIDKVYDYFTSIDEKFSVYKDTSEITHINQGLLKAPDYSSDMKTVFTLCEETKQLTDGYFDINHKGYLDPSGLVKGWAIYNAAQLLSAQGNKNFYIEAGGDIQASGRNVQHRPWQVGIRNPFNIQEIVKVVAVSNAGVATSGTYFRGQHVYNPKKLDRPITDVMSITVVGPNIYEADRFATAAFAMGSRGVEFIESYPSLEAYQIDNNGQALFTSGFNKYLSHDQNYR